MILMTVFGNVLVVLSVVVYKRMRTFTNILLTSLATAGMLNVECYSNCVPDSAAILSDLLVGFVVMPMSLLDLLHNHRWPLGKCALPVKCMSPYLIVLVSSTICRKIFVWLVGYSGCIALYG